MNKPSRARPSRRAPVLRAYFGNRDLYVDMFAGGGGASMGGKTALGRGPDIAINHSPAAIAMHAANHPETRHFIENVFRVDPRRVTEGMPVALLWASPTCTHFSKAKGDALDDESIRLRGLAWSILPWIVHSRPGAILLENVEEFQKWGPLHRTHSHGCSRELAAKNKARWSRSKIPLAKRPKKLGCKKTGCLLDCHRNTPIKSRQGETFHAFVAKIRSKGYYVDWGMARGCDFGAPTTRKRLFLRMFADGHARPWPEPSHGPGKVPYRVAADIIDWSIPCPSIFDRERPLKESTLRRIARGVQKFVIDAAQPFIVPATHGANAHGPDMRSHSVTEPLRTLTTRGAQAHLVTPMVIKAKSYGGGGNDAMRADEPLRTIVSKQEFAVAVPYLIHKGNGERPGQDPRTYPVTAPHPTVVSGGIKTELCVAFLNKHNGGHEATGQRMDTPVDALCATNTKGLTVAHVVRYNTETSAGSARGQVLDAPLSTLDTSNRFALATSHLVKLRGTSPAHLDSSASSAQDPVPAVSAGGTHIAEVRAFLVRYNGQSGPQPVTEPIGTLDTTDRYGLATVTIAGELYEIVDIGMRMLTPRELFLAQGFDPDYEIAPIGPKGKPLTKTEQIRAVGNSVCPPVAAAFIASALAPPIRTHERLAA